MALGPQWFLGVDVLFDVVFAVVTLFIALTGYRAYRFAQEARYLRICVAFAMLCFSYVLLGIMNFLTFIREGQIELAIEKMMDVPYIIEMGLDLRAVIFLLSLTVLIFLYYKIDDVKMQALLLLLVLFGFALSPDTSSMFYVLASILLLFIWMKLLDSYLRSRKSGALLVLVGFGAIFLGRVIMSILFVSPFMYVTAHAVTLAGFLSIAASQMVPRR